VGNVVSSHGKVLESMRGLFLSTGLHLFIRVALGLVFMYAGFAKLLDPKAFAITVSHYDIIPQFLLPPFAVGLPVMELIAGLGLVINVRGSLAVIFALLVLFSLVLGYGVFNGMDIDCGCFSPEEIDGRNNIKKALLRDLLMIVAAFYLYMYRRVKGTTDPGRKNKIHYKEEEV
jgi:uncharacterized membrane protein YphA (DoxX/SURF4 family)